MGRPATGTRQAILMRLQPQRCTLQDAPSKLLMLTVQRGDTDCLPSNSVNSGWAAGAISHVREIDRAAPDRSARRSEPALFRHCINDARAHLHMESNLLGVLHPRGRHYGEAGGQGWARRHDPRQLLQERAAELQSPLQAACARVGITSGAASTGACLSRGTFAVLQCDQM